MYCVQWLDYDDDDDDLYDDYENIHVSILNILPVKVARIIYVFIMVYHVRRTVFIALQWISVVSTDQGSYCTLSMVLYYLVIHR